MHGDREQNTSGSAEEQAAPGTGVAGHDATLRAPCPLAECRDSARIASGAASPSQQSCSAIRSIIESISDAFFSLDDRWRFTYVNETGERLLGRKREDLLENCIWDLFPEARGLRFEHEYKRALSERVPVFFEEYYPPNKTWYEVRAYPSEVGISVYFADITPRKVAEEELKKDSRRFALLAWTSNQLLLAVRPQSTLQQLCEEAMKELNCDTFLAYLNDDNHGCLNLQASAGFPPEDLDELRHPAHGQGVEGTVALRGYRIVLSYIQSKQELGNQRLRALGLRAYACYPLIADHRVLGTLSFGTRSRERLAQQELDLIEAFANQLAIAMERRFAEDRLRQLHLKEQEHAERLEAEVRSRTAQLAAANTELKRRNALLQSLAFQLSEAEQRERRRLSEVLHDKLQQLLVAAKFRAGIVARREATSAESLEDLRKVDELLNESISVSRSLAHELSPPILEKAGLGPALKWLGEHMSQIYEMTIHVDVDEDLKAASASGFLFGAARELLLNVVKHAGVREAWLEAKPVNGYTCITVRDQGAGFQADSAEFYEGKPAGLGLFAMRERVAVLGGRMDIESSPGKGARITVSIPEDCAQFGNSKF
ncbi:MAG TPA: GAF domain-containing protein [Acidobacteriota bacterium]|nr:GAF domain-containing protein [Acidobacteriota bacterium]